MVAYLANGFAKGFPHFGHQGQAEGVHVVKVPIETGWHDTGAARHFAQAQAAKATAAVHQATGSVHQGVAGLQFLFGARL